MNPENRDRNSKCHLYFLFIYAYFYGCLSILYILTFTLNPAHNLLITVNTIPNFLLIFFWFSILPDFVAGFLFSMANDKSVNQQSLSPHWIQNESYSYTSKNS